MIIISLHFRDCSALVLTLGSMTMKTVPRKRDAPALTDLVTRGMSQEEVVEVVRSSSYDHFTIELVDTQVRRIIHLFVQQDDKTECWKKQLSFVV